MTNSAAFVGFGSKTRVPQRARVGMRQMNPSDIISNHLDFTNAAPLSSPLDSMMTTLAEDSIQIQPATSFEPVLNVPALGAFSFVMFVFAVLRFRVSRVEAAVAERQRALEDLRVVKKRALDEDIGQEVLERAARSLLEAMRREEDARTVIPGVVRLVPPGPGQAADAAAVAAAKQLLGDEIEIPELSTPRSAAPTGAKESEQRPLSPLAITVLASLVFILVGQVAFIAYLSFDSEASSVLFSGGESNNSML